MSVNEVWFEAVVQLGSFGLVAWWFVKANENTVTEIRLLRQSIDHLTAVLIGTQDQ